MAFKVNASGCIDNGADDGNLDADQGECGYNSVSGCCGCLRRPVVGSFCFRLLRSQRGGGGNRTAGAGAGIRSVS